MPVSTLHDGRTFTMIAEMGDGSGVAMIDGKMQDDATVKQAQVMIKTAELIAKRDKDLAKLYNL